MPSPGRAETRVEEHPGLVLRVADRRAEPGPARLAVVVCRGRYQRQPRITMNAKAELSGGAINRNWVARCVRMTVDDS